MSGPSPSSPRPLILGHSLALAANWNGRPSPGYGSRLNWLEADVPQLGAAVSREEYQLHLAALEWALDPTILIHSAEDIRARKHWQEMLEPFEHQVQNLITFCRRAPVALIADDVGLGKTISAGLILSELRVRGAVDRCLVLAPKLLGPQWREELGAKFGIRGEDAVGQDLLRAARGTTDVVITTYHSARSRMKQLADEGFDMLILDEAHHLRNLHGTANPPKMALAVRDALAARSFKYVLMLTATPIQNRLWDLYSLVDMLTVAKGHENPLGSTDAFVYRYIADTRAEARRLHPGRQDEFRRHLSQYMVRTRREDCGLLFPDRRVQLARATPSAAERALFGLVAGFIGGMNALVQTSIAQALMSSPHALLAQLRNMAGGRSGVTAQDVQDVERVVAGMGQTGKEKRLLELLRELRQSRESDWRVVIFTGRKETQDRLGEVIDGEFGGGLCGFIRGGQAAANQRAIRDYSATPPARSVIISTDAGAEGVNLQKGNVVVNYDLPWNPMLVEQRIGRVQRLGSEHANVSVLNLVLRGSVEERVVGRLQEKLTTISATIGDIEGVLESIGTNGSDEGSFESVIRELVVRSLEGRDVEEAVQRQLASIERAKKIYEDERREVEQQLGRMDAMHRDGPAMPQLSSVEPRLSEPAFTLAALRATGGQCERVDESSYRFARPGFAPELVCFDADVARQAGRERGIAGGRRVGLYRSGQAPFERLVAEWANEAHVYIKDLRGLGTEAARSAVTSWLEAEGVDVRVKETEVGQVADALRGTLVVRAAASVAHDKYEKLVELPVAPRGHEEPPESAVDAAPLIGSGFDAQEQRQSIEDLVKEGMERDPDFEAFSGFYLRRLDEELRRAMGRPVLEQRAAEDFTPTLSARLVGAEGVAYSTVKVRAHLCAEGGAPEPVELVVTSWGRVVEAPGVKECSITRMRAPEPMLAQCSVTGTLAWKHLLVRSAASGRLAVAAETGTCQVTGAALLKSELGRSAVSGQEVDARLLVSSEVSDQVALESELVRCEVTGRRCLPRELAISEVSGRRFVAMESRTGGERQLTGHESEFGQCSESAGWFPMAELGRSDVTGSVVAKSLLVRSEKPPHRAGARSEVRECAVSGKQVLVDEVGTSVVTGDAVDLDLLEKSVLSGRPAEPARMVACEVTGDRVLPDEVLVCEATRRVARKDLCGKSDVSGKCVLASELVQSAGSPRMGLREEMVACSWDGRLRVPQDTARCSVSGLITGAEHLTDGRVLTGLVRLASDGAVGHPFSEADLRARGVTGAESLLKLKAPAALVSPDGKGLLVVGQRAGFLGMGRHLRFGYIRGSDVIAEGRLPNQILG